MPEEAETGRKNGMGAQRPVLSAPALNTRPPASGNVQASNFRKRAFTAAHSLARGMLSSKSTSTGTKKTITTNKVSKNNPKKGLAVDLEAMAVKPPTGNVTAAAFEKFSRPRATRRKREEPKQHLITSKSPQSKSGFQAPKYGSDILRPEKAPAPQTQTSPPPLSSSPSLAPTEPQCSADIVELPEEEVELLEARSEDYFAKLQASLRELALRANGIGLGLLLLGEQNLQGDIVKHGKSLSSLLAGKLGGNVEKIMNLRNANVGRNDEMQKCHEESVKQSKKAPPVATEKYLADLDMDIIGSGDGPRNFPKRSSFDSFHGVSIGKLGSLQECLGVNYDNKDLDRDLDLDLRGRAAGNGNFLANHLHGGANTHRNSEMQFISRSHEDDDFLSSSPMSSPSPSPYPTRALAAFKPIAHRDYPGTSTIDYYNGVSGSGRHDGRGLRQANSGGGFEDYDCFAAAAKSIEPWRVPILEENLRRENLPSNKNIPPTLFEDTRQSHHQPQPLAIHKMQKEHTSNLRWHDADGTIANFLPNQILRSGRDPLERSYAIEDEHYITPSIEYLRLNSERQLLQFQRGASEFEQRQPQQHFREYNSPNGTERNLPLVSDLLHNHPIHPMHMQYKPYNDDSDNDNSVQELCIGTSTGNHPIQCDDYLDNALACIDTGTIGIDAEIDDGSLDDIRSLSICGSGGGGGGGATDHHGGSLSNSPLGDDSG